MLPRKGSPSEREKETQEMGSRRERQPPILRGHEMFPVGPVGPGVKQKEMLERA